MCCPRDMASLFPDADRPLPPRAAVILMHATEPVAPPLRLEADWCPARVCEELP